MIESPRALVTGASGYIGSHVARALSRAGWVVAGLTRRPVPKQTDTAAGTTMFTADGTFDSIRRAVEGARPDVVFHLAGVTTAAPRGEDVDAMIRSNVLLVAQLAEAMRLARIGALVNTGTYWQYARDGTTRPNTLYAAAKQAAESILDFSASAGLRVATLVLHDVYGPDDPRPKLLAQLAVIDAGGPPLDLSDGTQTVDYVYVDDVARAYIRAGEWLRTNSSARGGGRHERFMVRGQRPLTLRAVVEMLAAARGLALPIRWGKRPARDHDIQEPWLGGRPVPGWKPEISLEDGLRRIVQAAALT